LVVQIRRAKKNDPRSLKKTTHEVSEVLGALLWIQNQKEKGGKKEGGPEAPANLRL